MNENSKKKSLRAIISKIVTALIFVSGLAFMGVALALQSISVNMTGQVIFKAKSVYCDITGEISGMTTNLTLEDVHIANGENVSSSLSPATWQNLTLDFASETSSIVVTISIHNLSEERSLYVDIDDAFGSINNLEVLREVGSSTFEESNFDLIEVGADQTKTFKITLSIENTSKSIDGAFTLAINLASEANVNSTEEFISELSSSSSSETKFYKLSKDIDLTSYGSTQTVALSTTATSPFTKYDNEVYVLFNSFKGVIDGGGHTIKMNAVGNEGTSFLFGELEGRVQNITLEFNSDGVVSALAYISKGDLTLENVTTTGSVSFDSFDGYSPLVAKAKGTSISFINCTSDVDINATSGYGSAFLGNRVYGTKASKAGKTYMDYSSENANANYTSEHIVVDNKVVFSGCTNTGTIMMPNATLLYGNVWDLPDRDCIVIENCVNNGLVIGAESVGYISQMRAGELNNNNDNNTGTDREFWHRGQYLADLEAYASQNITGSGSKTQASLSNLSVTKNSNNEIVISNSNSGTYKYVIKVGAIYDLMEGGVSVQTISASALFTITSSGNTGVKYLNVGTIKDASNKEIQVSGKTYKYTSIEEVTNSNMTLNGIATKLKIATLENGTQVYAFEVSATGTVQFRHVGDPMRITTYEVTSNGDVLKDIKKSI